MASETFKIPEENLGRFQSIMARINARANKLGFDPITFEIGEGVKTTVRDNSGEPGLAENIIVVKHQVTVTGVQPVLSGYRFVGKVEHLPGTSETIVKGDVPKEYHQCEPNCDHCHTNRQRAETVILQNIETGGHKQVGKSCLKDFFNGDDPMKHASFMQYLFNCMDELRDSEEYDYSGGNGPSYLDPMQVLPLAAAEIRTSGYITSGKAEELGCIPTGMLVRNMLGPGYRGKIPEITAADRAKADSVLAWLVSDDAKAKKLESSYMQNLCVMAETGLVSKKNIGIMASAIMSYDKNEADKVRLASMSISEYIGEVDGKIGPLCVTVLGMVLIPNEQFGDKMLYRMADDAGNQITWFNSGGVMADVGDRVHINATVKAHSEYRGVKQTTLLRVTALENNLCSAVEMGKDVKSIKKLLKDEINLDHVSSRQGRTALMIAAQAGRDDLLDTLLDAGANPDFALPEGGETAAMMAATAGFATSVATLAKWGANLDLPSKIGDTATGLLAESQQELCAKASRFEAVCEEPEGRVAAGELAWANLATYPIDALGKPCKEWADCFDVRLAEEEERGNAPNFTRSVSGLYREPVIVVQRAGALYVWSGHDQIAYAARSGDKTLPVVLGSDSLEFAPYSAPAQAVKAPKAKPKAKLAEAWEPV